MMVLIKNNFNHSHALRSLQASLRTMCRLEARLPLETLVSLFHPQIISTRYGGKPLASVPQTSVSNNLKV